MGAIDPSVIIKRLDAGRECYAAWVGEVIAAYGWLSFDEEFVSEFNLQIRLMPGEAYIWNCATLPAYSGRRLYSGLLAYMVAELRGRPVHRVWICTDQLNAASQRGIARAGFQHAADLILSRVLAMRFVYVMGQPDVPESLVSETRRVFLDNRDNVWLSALSSARS